jgi:pimeloyl-ACP methyl ester carboxylesterase
MNLVSAELTRKARGRGERREMQVMDTVTRYWFYPADSESAPSIVFIHGYRGNHRGLEAIAGALSDFNIYIPDLPGFGESTPFVSAHSIENYSWWVGEFIRKLQLPHKPHLLGHSFGSIIVSHHAAHAADFDTLILENPVSAPALKGPKAALTLLAKSFFDLAPKLPSKTANWALKSWPMVRGMSIVMTKSHNKKLREWIHRQHDENFNDFESNRVAFEGYSASISHHVSEYAARFQRPTLVLIGTKDDITSPSQQRQMVALLKVENRLVEHRAVGHLTHYEIPDLIAEDIREFLQSRNAN